MEVSALGLGDIGMSSSYGVLPDKKEMIKLLRNAVELAVTFLTLQKYMALVNEIGGRSNKPD